MSFLPTTHENKPVYAGFFLRTYAELIEPIVVWIVPMSIHFIASKFSEYGMSFIVFTHIFCLVLYLFYGVFFDYRYGGCLAKLVVGIKITFPNGRKIGLKQVLKRQSVNIFCTSLICLGHISILSLVDAQSYLNAGMVERASLSKAFYPDWLTYTLSLQCLWFWCNGLTVLLNRHKRSLLDYIAGTVVIYKEFVEHDPDDGELQIEAQPDSIATLLPVGTVTD